MKIFKRGQPWYYEIIIMANVYYLFKWISLFNFSTEPRKPHFRKEEAGTKRGCNLFKINSQETAEEKLEPR